MEKMVHYGRAAAIGATLSLAVHLVLALMLWRLPPAGALTSSRALAIDFDVPPPAPDPSDDRVLAAPEASGAVAHLGERAPLEPGGVHARSNVDTTSRGERGDELGAMQVVLLVPRADGITLQDSPMNALRVSQTQRILTAVDRASVEDRRATPNPADVPFLASGTGVHPERRPIASIDPAVGARVAPAPSVIGQDAPSAAFLLARAGSTASATVRAEHGDIATASPGAADATGASDAATRAAHAGATVASPGRGIAAGAGVTSSERARVALGRPPVDQGPAATTTVTRDARVRDDTDSELLAARMLQSVVESSARRGRVRGAGEGGVGGGGAPGSGGGEGAGGLSAPYGPGHGAYDSLDTSDGRYERWFLDQRARVDRALRFPRERALTMDQGTSVYHLVVRRDGSLAGAPRLVRSSGFDDFDDAALLAITRAAPFPALPRDLAPDLTEIRVTLPVEFSNPMVR